MLHLKSITSILEIKEADWQMLECYQYPFLSYAFLSALEISGSVGKGTGWIPHHFVIYDDQQLVGALPSYIKYNSNGEYVFDWAWADAYARNGLDYYPKLLSAIPFTPASGPRFIQKPGTHIPYTLVYKAIKSKLESLGASSWHLLFPTPAELDNWKPLGLGLRKGVQFHWHNQNYRDFDDFLDGFVSRKRKNINKERRCITEQAITLQRINGQEINPEQLSQFYAFYQATYLKHGQQGYLSAAFFKLLVATMPGSVLFVFARCKNRTVATALFIVGGNTLYGRYWGCLQEYDKLHFETCYYQGIDYCIEHGLRRFDPGAQGEHKIPRGFEPTPTWSLHYFSHPGFRSAIEEYLVHEKQSIDAYEEEMRLLLPFKKLNSNGC